MTDEHPTNGSDPWESEMSREFEQRVRNLHEAPLTFDNVKGKAMTIQRNRRIAVAGGILAAAAVIVPVAVLVGNDLGDDDEIPAATSSPSPTQATDSNDPSPTVPPVGTVGASYLEGATWHREDGSTVELAETYFWGVELDDELLAARNDGGAWTVDVIDPAGDVAESFDVLSMPPVANADNTTVAYISADGALMTRWADGEVAMGEGFVDGDSAAAVSGGPNCFEDVDGCVVFVNHGDGSTPEVLDSHGIRDIVAPGAIKVRGVSADGRVALQTSSSDTGSCSAVLDQSGSDPVFETCDATLFGFSPGGGLVSGSDAYLDGIGLGYVTILDAANGKELSRFTPHQGFVRETVWEDDDSLLVNTYEEGEWRIYRLGVDGSTDQVASAEGTEDAPAFTLLGSS